MNMFVKATLLLLILTAFYLTLRSQVFESANPSFSDIYGETDITFGNAVGTTVPSFNITDCTNASPIVVTTSAAHGVANTEWVVIEDVTGNTACNGIFEAASVAATTMALVGSTGDGAYIGGGILGGFQVVAGTWADGNLSNFTSSAAGLLTYTGPTPRQVFALHTESTNLAADPGNPICHYAIMRNGDVSPKTVAERNLPSTAAFGSSSGFALLQLINGDTLQLMVGCVEPSGAASYDVMADHAALMAITF